jgi:TolA-binding protein
VRACYLLPLVELFRDGRLDARERASMERHLEDCAECQASQRDLSRLSELLRDGATPREGATVLDHRRGRMRLLQAAAHLETPPERTTFAGLSAAAIPARVGWAMPAGAIALAALVVLGAGRFRARSATDAPAAAAVAANGAASEAAPAIAPLEEAASNTTPPPSEAPADPAPPLERIARPSAPRAVVSPPTPQPAAPAPAPQATFAEGVGSMEQGNFGEAIDRLGAFRKSHPEDSRSEDAAFLMIVALQRAGRHSDAVAAAREYLTLYPSGYRRLEAQGIVARGQ